jgi:long-chain acyl-CoA synthetase
MIHLTALLEGPPPEKAALVFGERTFTYGEVRAAVDHLAAGLQFTFHPGDRMALWLPNGPDLVFLVLACLKTGVVPLPLHAGMKEAEVGPILTRARPRGLVCHRPLAPERTGGARHLFQTGPALPPYRPLADLTCCRNPVRPAAFAPPDLALVLHTSGTHGMAKGVMLSRGSVEQVLRCRFERAGITAQSVALVASCLTQTIGLYQVLALLAAGGTVVLLESYDTGRMVEALHRHRPTHLHMVVQPFHQLLGHPDVTAGTFQSLTFVAAGGDRVTEGVQTRFRRLTGRCLGITYGLTELNWVMANPGLRPDKALALGLPCADTDVVLRGAGGEAVPDGRVGELWVRGPKCMTGYLHDEALTRAAFAADGWLATGDLLSRDPDGYYWFEGRRKNLIVLATGDKVSPVEVETVLAAHPAVAACAVVGMAGPDGGSVPCALVTRRDPGLTEEALTAFLRERLSEFKIPRRILFQSELPTGLTGKVHPGKVQMLLASR